MIIKLDKNTILCKDYDEAMKEAHDAIKKLYNDKWFKSEYPRCEMIYTHEGDLSYGEIAEADVIEVQYGKMYEVKKYKFKTIIYNAVNRIDYLKEKKEKIEEEIKRLEGGGNE